MADGDDPKSSTERHSPRAIGEQARAARRQFSPSASRNTQPIIGVLSARLPRRGRALEIASGTGQHVAAFAEAFPGLHWQPSDPELAARDSIAAWRAQSGAENLAPPIAIDVTAESWADDLGPGFDGIVAINLLHISRWAATEGLMRGVGRLLSAHGVLAVYGCFKRDGAHISQSNVDFDASLRRRNPAWGVRDIGDVASAAERHSLHLDVIVPMPANNFTLIFRRG